MRQKVLKHCRRHPTWTPSELELSKAKYAASVPPWRSLLDLSQVLELASPTSRYNQGEMARRHQLLPPAQTPYAYGNHATHVTIDAETGQMTSCATSSSRT